MFSRTLPRFLAASAIAAALSSLAALPLPASAQSSVVTLPTANPPIHVRGTLVSADAKQIVVKSRDGRTVTLARANNLSIAEIYPIELKDIKQGSFIGTTGMPQPDGSQKAIEVHVFPPALRGSGEGHYAWDLQPGSTMTNADVAELAPAPASVLGGRKLKLRYGGGEQMVVVPPGAPIVEIALADDKLLAPGAKVIVSVQDRDGTPTATSLQAGRDGFTPPY